MNSRLLASFTDQGKRWNNFIFYDRCQTAQMPHGNKLREVYYVWDDHAQL